MNYSVAYEMSVVFLICSIAHFDVQGRDHDKMMEKVLCIYRQENLKLNKDKSLFRSISIPFFGEKI